jgi:hypothetical protein
VDKEVMWKLWGKYSGRKCWGGIIRKKVVKGGDKVGWVVGKDK